VADPSEESIEAVVEIVRGSRNKYEINEKTGAIHLDRVLYSSVHYPTDYGFIPETLAEDGDALDVLIVVQEPTIPGCHMRVRPLGMLEMSDEKGLDHKIVAVPVAEPRFSDVRELSDLAEHWLLEIRTFFLTYKILENKPTEVGEWHDREQAWKTIVEAQERYANGR
jgi:inorganic pyrophosphatase